jgi:hypothetical protein
MGLLTERDAAGDAYEEVTIPLAPIEAAAEDDRPAEKDCAPEGAAEHRASEHRASETGASETGASKTGAADGGAAGKDAVQEPAAADDPAKAEAAASGDAESGSAAASGDDAGKDGASRRELTPGGGVMLRRRSALPTRRCVLYMHCERDPFVPEDLVTWYTERGFHFYVVDLRPEEALDRPARHRGRPGQAERLARIDAACRHLREAEGIDMIVVGAHAAGALTAALWCHARRDAGLADALILSRPAFGRRLRGGLDIACPVLVLSPPEGRRRRPVGRTKSDAGADRLGPHVTWLRLEDGLDGQTPKARAGRRQFFDEMGRWLGAYMYGSIRDQLL